MPNATKPAKREIRKPQIEAVSEEKKEIKTMPEVLEAVNEVKDKNAPAVVVTQKKQPISGILNLETGEEEKFILLVKTFAVNTELAPEDQLEAMKEHVQPVEEQVKALVKYAESKSYQDAKNAELSKGNYLTQQLRTAIVTILSNYVGFGDAGSKEIFDRWLVGYKAGKQSAKTILDQARAATSEPIDL